MKRHSYCWLNVLTALFVLMLIMSGDDVVLAADSSDSEVTVEQIRPGEWKMIRPDGEFVGTIMSDNRKSFRFFDAGGKFVGTVLESKAWFHRLYRKRNTQVTPEEARLYLNALKAIEAIK